MTTPQRGLTLDRWLAWFETVHPKRIDLRLDRFVAVLDSLGLRKPPYKVVTVVIRRPPNRAARRIVDEPATHA